MKRAGFQRKQLVAPVLADKVEARNERARQLMESVRNGPRVAATMAGSLREAIPKDVPAKPGKGAPDKAERAWMDAIVAYGCIACRMDGNGYQPAAVHHILRGGRRLGHLFTLPLCDPGHHQNGEPTGKISRHPWKARFEQKYGNEQFLLARLQAEIGEL